jgi:hypothetical protein
MINLSLKEDLTLLRKDQIGTMLSLEEKAYTKTKKDQLIEMSLHPSMVEEMLGISKTERKRWTDEKKLVVAGYDSFNRWGTTHQFPLYDCYEMSKITPEKIEEWRRSHKEQMAKNRKASVQKAKVTKEKNESLFEKFYEGEWKEMLKTWHKVDASLAAALQLAFWTVWLSRWAKEYQVKAFNAKSKRSVYEEKKAQYYALKNDSMALLSKTKFAKAIVLQQNAEMHVTSVM